MKPLVDTDVLFGMFFPYQTNGEDCTALASELTRLQIPCKVPMHAMFEWAAVLGREKRSLGTLSGKSNCNICKETPIVIEPIPIDQAFFDKYLSGEMPALRGGDLIFAKIAELDGLSLVTHDARLREQAISLGVGAYSAREYATLLSKF